MGARKRYRNGSRVHRYRVINSLDLPNQTKKSMNDGRIAVAYAGVHQAYQLALAAHEIGELKWFYCSLYDDPSKWGPRFANFIGPGLFEGRQAEGLDLKKVVEFPWPLLLKVARDRLHPLFQDTWLAANGAFDWWASRKVSASPPDIFVGTATSDLQSLKAAKARGSIVLHDCPSLHPGAESQLLQEAAERSGLRATPRFPWLRRGAMQSRKLREYSLADKLLVYSDFHRRGFQKAGFTGDRIFQSPLWVDQSLWYRTRTKRPEDLTPDLPLKLLFVGSISLRKGIPFLLQAVAECGKAVRLTIVGARTTQADRLLDHNLQNVFYVPAQPKAHLRRLYESHDLFILPSVGDPFPFVGLEAMACGLPIILSENCGTPVPDSSWKVPAMDPESLAKRIMTYVDNRMLLIEHGEQAAAFAAKFTPSVYRQNIQDLFRSILASRG
jgi:glycosyltransferase involved in cell wall biosynthesis